MKNKTTRIAKGAKTAIAENGMKGKPGAKRAKKVLQHLFRIELARKLVNLQRKEKK